MSVADLFNREDPYLMQFAVLSLVGIWHVESEKKWLRISYAVYRFLALFSLTILLFVQLTDVITLKEDLAKASERVCATGITCTVTLKTHLMLHTPDKFYGLQAKFKKFREMRSKHPADMKLIQETSCHIVSAAKFFYMGTLMAYIFWTFHPLLQEGNRKLPYPLRLPIESETSPNYELLYVYLSFILIMFTGSVVATVVGFSSSLTIINTHFRVVTQNIESITDQREEAVRRKRFWEEFNTGKCPPPKSRREEEENELKDAKTMEILRDMIQTQNYIYDEIQSFDRLQSKFLWVHILAVVLGMAIVETTALSDDFTAELAKRLLILVLGIIDLYSICSFGEELHFRSCEISEALYMIPWDEMGKKVQRVILIMSMRSRRPCIIKAGGTIPINLATYLNIMRACYNLMLILRHSASRGT